jgi:hypothetical protein
VGPRVGTHGCSGAVLRRLLLYQMVSHVIGSSCEAHTRFNSHIHTYVHTVIHAAAGGRSCGGAEKGGRDDAPLAAQLSALLAAPHNSVRCSPRRSLHRSPRFVRRQGGSGSGGGSAAWVARRRGRWRRALRTPFDSWAIAPHLSSARAASQRTAARSVAARRRGRRGRRGGVRDRRGRWQCGRREPQ